MKPVFLAVVIAMLLFACEQATEDWPSESFSPTAWKETVPEGRFVFYRDLAASGALDGATRESVIELLGEPGWTSPDGRYITYLLKTADPGEYTFNSIYLLHIDLDPQRGLVTGYRVRAD